MEIFRQHGSFKRQIVLTYTAGFFLLIAVFAAYLVRTESGYLYRDSYNEAAGLAQSLAVSSASWVLADDVAGLQEAVRVFHPATRYAMVLSPSGRVLAHNDAAKVGLFVSDPRSLALIKAPPQKHAIIDNATEIDIAVPIMAGARHIAWARIALGRKSITDNLHRMILSSVLFMLLAAVLALLSAWLIASRLGYRIGSLVRVAEEVQAGNFNARADIAGRDDEITKLANGLNRMLDALAQNAIQLGALAAIVESSRDAIFGKALDGRITSWNKGAEAIYGYSADEVIGKNITVLASPSFHAEIQEFLGAIGRGETVANHEAERIRKDGTPIHVALTLSPIRDASGNIAGASTIARDITGQKRVERALRESEAKFRRIVDTATEGFWMIDTDSLTTFVNARMADMLGYSAEDMIGKPATEFMFEEDRPGHLAKMSNRRSGILEHYERRFRCKDGQAVWTITSATPIFDDEHCFSGACALITDITERKQNEEVNASRLHLVQFSLTHSLDELLEETLNEAERLTGSLIGFYHFVEDDQITLTLQMWSTRTKAEFCKAEGKGLHYPISEAGVWVDCVREGKAVIHNDYASLPHRKGMPEGHATVVRELVVPVFRGEKISAILGVGNKTASYTAKDAEIVSLIASLAWEIAERKRMEEQVRLSEQALAEAKVQQKAEERLRLFFERQLVGMGIASPQKRWLQVNDKLCEMTGYSREEMERLTWAEMTYPEDLESDASQFELLLKGETEGYTLEKRFMRKDGSIVFANLSVGCVRRAGGQLDYTLALMEDITERKQVEENIKKLNEELRQRARALETANKELESFSYLVSHNLRTPLRAIAGFSGIMLDDYADKFDDEGKRLLNVVRNNTIRMGTLIDDILKFIRTGRVEMKISEADMDELAREALAEAKLAGPCAGDLQTGIGPLPPARGDISMLRQVFLNLFANAIKFSRHKQAPRIEAGGYIEGDEAVYFVKDNGAGFDMKYVGKLFGVFQRLHGVEEFEGTGIGLAIVKRIVNRHGGRAWAVGELDKGATIYFALPTGDAAAAEAVKNLWQSGPLFSD